MAFRIQRQVFTRQQQSGEQFSDFIRLLIRKSVHRFLENTALNVHHHTVFFIDFDKILLICG